MVMVLVVESRKGLVNLDAVISPEDSKRGLIVTSTGHCYPGLTILRRIPQSYQSYITKIVPCDDIRIFRDDFSRHYTSSALSHCSAQPSPLQL